MKKVPKLLIDINVKCLGIFLEVGLEIVLENGMHDGNDMKSYEHSIATKVEVRFS